MAKRRRMDRRKYSKVFLSTETAKQVFLRKHQNGERCYAIFMGWLGGKPQVELAKEYGLRPESVCRIIHRAGDIYTWLQFASGGDIAELLEKDIKNIGTSDLLSKIQSCSANKSIAKRVYHNVMRKCGTEDAARDFIKYSLWEDFIAIRNLGTQAAKVLTSCQKVLWGGDLHWLRKDPTASVHTRS